MTGWRIADAGGQRGPLDEDAVKAALRRGQISRRALVWSGGMAEWAPIDEVFPGQRAPAPRGSGAEGAVLALATLLYLLSAAGAVFLNYLGGLDRVGSGQAATVWLAVGVGLAVTSIVALAIWWRSAGRCDSLEARGAIRILASVLAIGGAGLSGLMLHQAPLISEFAQATEAMRTYRFDYRPETRTLRATGMIGPEFARTLKSQLRADPVDRFEIDSQGGLLGEAMQGARLLQERPDLEVVARRQCASACIILLMGGNERLADYDMGIDFHASDTVAARGNRWVAALGGAEGRRAERYMISRGAPADLIAEADRIGPGMLFREPSINLVARGMLTGLVDAEGRPLSVTQARARLEVREAQEGEPPVGEGSFLNR